MHVVDQREDWFGSLGIDRVESDALSVGIVPGSGGRIASLRDRVREYEWMWAPPEMPGGALTRSIGDDFAGSPLVGADECIPTVGPCVVDGTEMPDHGEAWTKRFAASRAANGAHRAEVELRRVPMRFARTASVTDATLRLDYEVHRLDGTPRPWLWSWHPLMVMPSEPVLSAVGVHPSCRLESGEGVTASDDFVRTPLDHDAGPLRRLNLGGPGRSAKLFFDVEPEGSMTLADSSRGVAITVAWRGEAIRGLGLWINRGGWNGFEHVAIEPCTRPLETAAEVPVDERMAQKSTAWSLEVSVHQA